MEKQVSPPKGKGGYLEALLNSCPDAILAINAEGTITFANKEACKLAEREMRELVGESIAIVYENMESAKETNRKLYMSGGVIHDHESKFRAKSGKLIPVRVSASHLQDSAGEYIGAVGFFEKYRPWSAEEAKVKVYAEELEAKLEEWKDLGAPVFELYPELSAAVMVGRLDAGRFERITENLLNHLKSVKTRVVLMDLSAALVTDSNVAPMLLKTVRILRLLGAHCVLAGIQSSVAQAMEPLVADLGCVESYYSTDVALEAALDSIGLEICEKE
ncbi:PAS domain-containing protein [Chloroflexota bacterium]